MLYTIYQAKTLQSYRKQPEDPLASTILLTSLGQNAFDKFPRLQPRWLEACYKALEQGWSLHHLWRLDTEESDTNHQHALSLIKDSLKLLGTGRYLPEHFRQSGLGLLNPPYDLLIIPEIAAMWFFASENPLSDDAAVVFRNRLLIEHLQGHFDQMTSQTSILTRSYNLQDINEKVAFWEELDEAEESLGSRLLVKQSGLSSLTRPDSWYVPGSPWLETAKGADMDEQLTRKHFERRKEAFEQQIHTYDYLEMCPMHAIAEVVRSYVYPRDTALGFEYKSTAEEVRGHLQNAVKMLREYPHYQLALLDQEEERRILVQPFWEVTGNESVLIQTWFKDPAGDETDLGIKITEETVVKTFHTYFNRLWNESVSAQHRD
jgi:hypothetical protein